ncbi:MAG TPA: dipicolinate synthase subunit B [Candidatus Gemmiger faecavium]|nr:dipicolinate synthase subunit B [Candidatus Gemmiger faecavium]
MNQRIDLPRTVVFALCGSFCTFDAVMPQIERLTARGWDVLPLLSFSAGSMDTRFGRAGDWRAKLEELTGHHPIDSIQGAEPLGPAGMACAMIVAPCTGTTLARLALGLSDTPVTMGVKSMLRGGLPIILAPSTNDGLGASAGNIAALLQRKHFYFVPFGQDDSYKKPCSLKSDMNLLPDTLDCALRGIQLQPLLL